MKQAEVSLTSGMGGKAVALTEMTDSKTEARNEVFTEHFSNPFS